MHLFESIPISSVIVVFSLLCERKLIMKTKRLCVNLKNEIRTVSTEKKSEQNIKI